MRSRFARVALLLLLPATAIAQIPQSEYAARRTTLAARLPGDGVVLALGAPEPREDYLAFFQTPPFEYLTGYDEPQASLLIVRRGGATTSTLFVQPKNPAAEVWTGTRYGPAGAKAATGIDARVASAMRPALDSLVAAGLPLYVVGDLPGAGGADEESGGRATTADEQFVQALRRAHPQAQIQSAAGVVSRMRGRKSPAELELLRKAAAITVDAHREAMAAAEPGLNEFELQALIEYTFRRNGADRPGFASIVGSGPNSTTLHYNRNDRFTKPGDVIVMDIGALYQGYSADVTRTVPVNGTFSTEQREIYRIVRAAQAAAERQARVGVPWKQLADSAATTLGRGLATAGLVDSAAATYECAPNRRCAQLALFYMHGLGHGIGLEVHDPEQYYFSGTMDVGSAFTLEPGIYVRPNLLEIVAQSPGNARLIDKLRPVVQKYAGIGIRIEDDYVISERGLEWISRAPRELEEVEAAMKEPSALKRDAAKVGWYR